MTATQKMTDRAVEIRDQILTDAVTKHGRSVVEAWSRDEATIRIINAMAQSQADQEARPGH